MEAGRPCPKKREEHRELEGAFLRLHLAHRYVDAVADGREHIKADAQRQSGESTGSSPGTNALMLSAAKPAYLKTPSAARSAAISSVSSGRLCPSRPSARPPSQFTPASATRRAAPRSPAHAKNNRLNAPKITLRARRGTASRPPATAAETQTKIVPMKTPYQHCSTQRTRQGAPFHKNFTAITSISIFESPQRMHETPFIISISHCSDPSICPFMNAKIHKNSRISPYLSSKLV